MTDFTEDMELVQESFTINNDATADWAIEKIKEARADIDRRRQLVADKIAALNMQLVALDDEEKQSTGFLSGLLDQYMNTVKLSKSTKTKDVYKLSSGNLVRKRHAPKIIKDEAVLANWLLARGMGDYTQVIVKPLWAELKKADVEISSGCAISKSTGEIIEGITLEEVPDTFEVE